MGEPDRRFREDALRILRGLRFASVLDFKIEEATVRSMKQETRRLQNISEERIFSELKKLICGEGVLRVLLDFPDIFAEIIPELSPCIGFDQKSRYHCYDVYEHTARTVSYCEPDAAVRLAALFHDIAKPQTFTLDQKGGHFYGHPARSAEMTESILRRLRADTKTIQTVCTLVLYHDRVIPPEKRAVKRMLSKMPLETFLALQKLRYGDRMAHAPEHRGGISELRTIEKLAAEIVKEKECFSIKQLNIKGSDLMRELSMPEGKEVGRLLRMLTDEVIDEKLKNEKSALLKRAGELYAKRCTDA